MSLTRIIYSKSGKAFRFFLLLVIACFVPLYPSRADFFESGTPVMARPAESSANVSPGLMANSSVTVPKGAGGGKSYIIPALEIPAFILLLNACGRIISPDDEENGKKVYDTSFSGFTDHVAEGPWGFDLDDFSTNQFMHPYQGAVYHNLARSAGLNYWESAAYTFVGSFLWETGGETTSPSFNDQVASGIAGSFFGEPLHRMASLLLEGEKPSVWRELFAAGISPPLGFNRLMFGDRFKPVFASRNPAIYWRLRLGASLGRFFDQDESIPVEKADATLDFSMAYGLPGKPGYDYKRPFDYFHFQATASSNTGNPLENIMIRGLLAGRKYEAGDSYKGIWGLYGGYDYISPEIFRVSSTAFFLGTTFRWRPARSLTLQGSGLGGVGYGAAGTIAGAGERNYHYGVAPQGLVALRLILGDRAMLDATGRAYYISDLGGTEPGREDIVRWNAGLTVRVYGRHAAGIQYIASRRDAYYPGRTDTHQTTGALSLVYTLLGKDGFGVVE